METPSTNQRKADHSHAFQIEPGSHYARRRPGALLVRTATALQVVAVDVTQVRSDRAGYVANKVVFVVVNNSRIDYKGGDLYTMGHMFADGLTNPTQGPAVFKPSDMTRGFLPAVQAGQSITIGMIAYTPEKGSFDNYARLAVGQ